MRAWMCAVVLLVCALSAASVRATAPLPSDFRTYSEAHALRLFNYSMGTNCVPGDTFIATYLRSGAYPHVPPVVTHVPPLKPGGSVIDQTGQGDGLYGWMVMDPADDAIILVFRGSRNTANFITDAHYHPTQATLCKRNSTECVQFNVHEGFWESFLILRSQVEKFVDLAVRMFPDGLIHVGGHSLGGALAQLFAADLMLRHPSKIGSLYTFGQPRVASQELASLLQSWQLNYFRVVNRKDPVPHIPQTVDLAHGGTEVWYDTDVGAQPGQSFQMCTTWVSGDTCSETAFTGSCALAAACLLSRAGDHVSYFSGSCGQCAPTYVC